MAGRSPHIRPAERAHLSAVAAIELATFTDAWSAQMFERALAAHSTVFLVAMSAGEVRGYVVAQFALDHGEVQTIAVAAQAQGRGFGGALLEGATTALAGRGVRQVFLEVRASNRAAQGLYRRSGFAPCGRRRAYYRHPVEDALIWSKRIDPSRVSLVDKRT